MKTFNYNLKSMAFMPTRLLLVATLLLGFSQNALAQRKKVKALFLGNSFTGVNNLPLVIGDVASSLGDTLVSDANTPGGYTLQDHLSNISSTGKIAIGNWDYVVLQEQSQRPAFTDAEVAVDVFPYAKSLDSLVRLSNKCGRTVFFQTWGYKDGDDVNCPVFPPICTYEGMDSLLSLRYGKMAIDNKALLSPVGLVFNKIRAGMPSIDLYSTDGRHPSEAGTYAAAITFYTILFRNNPSLIPFNYTLPAADADFIRKTVMIEVYNKLLKFHVGEFDPLAAFTNSISSLSVSFNSSTSKNVVSYMWDFGDGGTSTAPNPTHNYTASGTYSVRLIVQNCSMKDTMIQSVKVSSTGIQSSSVLESIQLFPNPTSSTFKLQSSLALSSISLNLVNLMGQKVLAIDAYNGQDINIEHLAHGVYIVELKDKISGAISTQKLIKE